MKPVKNLGMVGGSFWGLLRKPDALPVLFGSRQAAEENRDFDEYLVEVRVHPASAMALLRGRQELLRRQKAAAKAKARPRIPVEQKRRRGSAVVKLKGGGMVHRALKEMEPKLRRRFAQVMNEAVVDIARGKRKRAAAPRVRR